MRDVAVVAYGRTGIAKAGRGALNQTHGVAMLSHVLKNVVDKAGIEAGEIEDVIIGSGAPEGATGHNIARPAALAAGFPVTVPGITINRFCGSGLSAASFAAKQIASGEASIVVAGGVESLSLTRPNLNRAHLIYEPLQQRMPEIYWGMNETADYVAQKYGVSRAQQDEYALMSQRRVAAAIERGVFADEIVPFTTTMRATSKEDPEGALVEVTLAADEGPRPDTTLEALAKLKTVFPGGTITAGNASQLSDGAGALVLMDADHAARRGIPILGLFRSLHLTAVAPEEMSIAIAPAVRKLLKYHAYDTADIDLWELHEAYAVTAVYNQRVLETPWETTNVNGGAVPLGHPFGMTGIRYIGSTLLELARRNKQRAVVTTCASGGMGLAALLERA